ncbi:MAG: hypothetical protein GXZ02_07890 [Clostridiales bacterium]|nr:hypothetical protein [Clostridiales bacterium]
MRPLPGGASRNKRFISQLEGRSVNVTQYVIDDNANFFDDWQRDRKTYNITEDCFGWSPDDPAIDTRSTLSAGWQEIYTLKHCACNIGSFQN